MQQQPPVVMQGPPGGMVVVNQPPSQQQQIGLGLLAAANNLIISQKVNWTEVFTGFDTPNKYKVMNELGQDLFFAAEQSDCCARACLGKWHPWTMKMMTPDGSQIMNIVRPFRCHAHHICCYLQKLDVFDQNNNFIGTIQQDWAPFRRYLHVTNAQGQIIYEFFGPCCSPWTFRIRLPGNEQEIGQIRKQWAGLAKEILDAEVFGIVFPTGIDLTQKMLLTAAVFLIDFLYFERGGRQLGNAGMMIPI